MGGQEPNRHQDATRLSGLRLVIVALSLVGLITTYAAVDLFRYGGLATGLRDAIAMAQARQSDLIDLSRQLDDLGKAGTVPDAAANLDRAVARLAAWTDAPALQTADRDALLPQLSRWGVADARDRSALTMTLRRMTDFETAEIARFQTLWGNASREVSRILSLTLAAIVVLIATVVLRSLNYLHWRDRTETTLRRAKQEAERANTAKSEFLATVSHEIRTPLTGILGYADVLLSTSPRDDQHPRLQRLRQATETLGVLIDDLLDLSRIEAGRVEIAAAPFDLPAMLDRVVALIEPVATAKRLTLTLDAAPDLPPHVTGDSKRVAQILLNLLNNAVKFTDSGTVSLTVRASADGIAFTVTDTGIGIAAADMSKLFLRFSQIDGSNSRSYGGSGLGLAISRGLAEAMGGTIDVTSQAGAGSSFRLVLPLPAAAATGQPDETAAPPPRPARVLVVEDSGQNRDIIRTILEQAGHSVVLASDGIEGLDAATAGGFDLVVMDLQMPRMDGTEATKAIRTLPAPAGQVPILALSANVMASQIAAIHAAGANAHLGKPFTANGLLTACSALIRQDSETPPNTALATDALEAMVALMGTDWTQDRLNALLSSLRWLDAPPPDPVALRQKAHRLVSEAGQLGLAPLADAASAVEQAILSGDDTSAPMAALLSEAARARQAGPRLALRIHAA